jgi:Leucine-rich repeat (LRR) protein
MSFLQQSISLSNSLSCFCAVEVFVSPIHKSSSATSFKEICRNLPYQNLRGPLSPDIGKLDQLRRLGLHRNNLYGPIPQEIGNCTTLKALYLRDNFFTGNIPEELGNLTQLTKLDLSSNGLTGSIPESLGSLFKLTFL